MRPGVAHSRKSLEAPRSAPPACLNGPSACLRPSIEGEWAMKAGFLAIALALAVCASGGAAQSQGRWPNGARAVIVLTYDDALTSQLDHAIPVLDEAGFKGTFF